MAIIQGDVLTYSGANNPLWIIRKVEDISDYDEPNDVKNTKYKVVEISADKQPIGSHPYPRPFSLKTLRLMKGDAVYLFTDGFADQFGGTKKKKFMYRNFSELLLSIHDKPMEEQKHILNFTIEKWMGDMEQIDDILIVGMRH